MSNQERDIPPERDPLAWQTTPFPRIFENAIKNGALSRNPASPRYAGNYSSCGDCEGGDLFKHRNPSTVKEPTEIYLYSKKEESTSEATLDEPIIEGVMQRLGRLERKNWYLTWLVVLSVVATISLAFLPSYIQRNKAKDEIMSACRRLVNPNIPGAVQRCYDGTILERGGLH